MIQKKCMQVAAMEIQKNNVPMALRKTQTCRAPRVRNWMDERARNANCSESGRSVCQTEHLPPTSLYTYIFWHSLPRLLRVTLEERDVMERQWRQSQPGLRSAQARAWVSACSRHYIYLHVVVCKISSEPKQQSDHKNKSSSSSGYIFSLNKHKNGHETQRVFRVLKIDPRQKEGQDVIFYFLRKIAWVVSADNVGLRFSRKGFAKLRVRFCSSLDLDDDLR